MRKRKLLFINRFASQGKEGNEVCYTKENVPEECNIHLAHDTQGFMYTKV